ncbi:hypothetical protein BXZ70DRAFT_735146 [Cristinia sonorae]|uniref:Uncharacterized protein n=1 Tax=Cristinia sonorae TaxID=1940300 RepID=A0A8K0UVJ0_9AGAR|nr:hypothetical protein BXZ70DRAFT_735146 [Cristinia sonorae]
MPDWLYEPGPEIPLSQDDVRRLYRDQTDEDSLLSLGLSSIRAPSHAELQSLWDDSDSGSDDDGDDERLDDHDHDDDENAASSSDADTDSTSATLHDAHPPSPALKVPIAQPPLVLHPHSAESLWLYSYSAADPELETCLRCIEEELLCNPFSVYADVCYLATVKSEPQHGLLTRGSSELERVAEEDEEESDESEDEPEELHSPVQTGGGGKWSSGVCVGTSPESALSLPAAYIDSKPRCFVSLHFFSVPRPTDVFFSPPVTVAGARGRCRGGVSVPADAVLGRPEGVRRRVPDPDRPRVQRQALRQRPPARVQSPASPCCVISLSLFLLVSSDSTRRRRCCQHLHLWTMYQFNLTTRSFPFHPALPIHQPHPLCCIILSHHSSLFLVSLLGSGSQFLSSPLCMLLKRNRNQSLPSYASS